MKNLKNFLNPKSQWHPMKSFPNPPVKEDIIEYFEQYGIKRLDIGDPKSMTDIYIAFDKESSPVYILKDNVENHADQYWVRIAKGGRINEDNPIYTLGMRGNKFMFCGFEDRGWYFTDMKFDEFIRIVDSLVKNK